MTLTLFPTRAIGAHEPSWRKVFELPTSRAYFQSIWADENGWIAGAHGVIVRSHEGHVETTAVPGKVIMGFDSTEDGLFALGTEQSILRLDGTKWVDEHFSRLPEKAGGRQRDGAVLYRARTFHLGSERLTAAYGPWRVLVRQPDHSWIEPPESDRYRLSMLGQNGPPTVPRPPGCDREEWRRFGENEGWFSCAEGRSFRYVDHAMTATGRIPGPCRNAVDGAAAVGGDTYLLCRYKVWKNEGRRWSQLSEPRNVVAIAGNSRCLFAAAPLAIWEQCSVRAAAGR